MASVRNSIGIYPFIHVFEGKDLNFEFLEKAFQECLTDEFDELNEGECSLD